MGTRTCTHLEGRLWTEGARGVGDLRPAQAWQPRGQGCPVGPLPLPWGRKGGIVFVLEAGARSAAQCGSCGLRACGTAHRARGPPHPPPRSGSPPACPPMAMPRCVPPGLSALRRCDVCWSAPRSRGGAGGAQQVWRVAPTPPGDGRLCLWPQGPWGWQVGPSTGRGGVGGDQGDFFSDLRNRDRCVFTAHVCPCLTIAITAR